MGAGRQKQVEGVGRRRGRLVTIVRSNLKLMVFAVSVSPGFSITLGSSDSGFHRRAGPNGRDKCMYQLKFERIGIACLLALFAIIFGGCQSDQPETDQAALDAGRANVDAMSREHADDTADPSPAAQIMPSSAVISQAMAYTEHNDELIYGYFSAPADMFEPLPAVIMIHEWWGLNDNIHAMADRLAAEGYIVLAVDLFKGKVAANPGEARVLMMEAIEDPDSISANIRAAFNFVSATAGAPRIGSLGWGFGGGVSLRTAQLLPDDLDAAVIYYGQVTDDEDALRPVGAPILGLFGAEDTGIKLDSVQRFKAALERLRKNYTVHIYPGVGHAFANPTGRNYNAAVADDAWQRTLEFLDLHLAIKTIDDAG